MKTNHLTYNVNELLTFKATPKLPVILQNESAECALASVCMIANYHGHQIDISSAREISSVSNKGANLKQISNICNQLKLTTRVLKVEPEHLDKLKTPAILHWDMSHFVVLKKVLKNKIIVHDPAKGLCEVSNENVRKQFTGIAIEINKDKDFVPEVKKKDFGMFNLLRASNGVVSSLLWIFFLSIFMQLIGLSFPFFIKEVIDSLDNSYNLDFINLLATGFILLLVVKLVTQSLRAWSVLFLRSNLNIQLWSKLFRHLLSLPISWFEKRMIGDVISRFSSLDNIKELLSGGVVEGILDGFVALITLLIMFYLAPELTSITLAATVIFVCVRAFIHPREKARMNETVQLKAVGTGLFFESIRAIYSIKGNAAESVRQSTLDTANSKWINADIRLSKLKISEELVKEATYGIEFIAYVWLGAYMLNEQLISTGVFFALFALRMNFITSSQLFIDKVFEWKINDLHLDRIADIALETPEQVDGTLNSHVREIKGSIELQDVSFRYHETEPYIIKNFSLTIPAGECLALTGRSGCGKTTLLKLIAGLLKPTSGKILIDGIDIHALGIAKYRERCSYVLQGEELLSGTVADNISFFSPNRDDGAMVKAAEQANILDYINSLPMSFYTLVGDMGSSFSGGQIQRLLLARALYRQPKVMFLDEATSALDNKTESHINHALSELEMTRVLVAHRKETIAIADRVIDMTE